MLVKHHMCDGKLSQAPFMVCPAAARQHLDLRGPSGCWVTTCTCALNATTWHMQVTCFCACAPRGWADRRAIPDSQLDDYKNTRKHLVSAPWNMARAAKYLEEWTTGERHRLATASAPSTLGYLSHCSLDSIGPNLGQHIESFATAPARKLEVKVGAPNPKPKPRQQKQQARGRGARGGEAVGVAW